MIRLSALGLGLVALTLAGLSLHAIGDVTGDWMRAKTWLVGVLGVSAAIYLLAVGWVLHRPLRGRGIWVVLLVAAAMRIPLLLAPPFLSTDVFRYVWDGRVQAEGVNPYRYIPADPALQALRDAAIYPDINRADYARTIYPPAAQLVFAATGLLWSSVTGMKSVMLGFELLAVFCLSRLLALARLPQDRLLIYAWNPLPVWAFAGNGHVDAMAIGLIAAALLLRVRRRDGWAGAALGAAVLTKFLPLVIAPALWRKGGGWRMAAACGAVIIGLYTLYSSVGLLVFGFLGGYGAEEGMQDGSGIWLLAGLSRVIAVPPAAARVYFAVVLILLGALAAWIAFIRRPDDTVSICAASGMLMAVLTFAISPHYPWYFAWLAVPCVLAPSPAVLWLSVAPVLLYLDTYGDRFVWPSVVFAPAILLALRDFWRLRPNPAVEPIKGPI